MPEAIDTCSVCPRLCRHACPVAEGTAREAAVPATLATVLRRHRDGVIDTALATQAAALCVDCGRCMEACHLHVPLPDALASAWSAFGLVEAWGPVPAIEGSAQLVALETDDRSWAEALARRVGEPVGRWRIPGGVPWTSRGTPSWGRVSQALASVAAGRTVVVPDRASASALAAAGVPVRVLAEQLDEPAWAPSCAAGGACCGGHGPLAAVHPDDAARMAAQYPVEAPVADVGCAAHLRAHGRDVEDVVDRLLAWDAEEAEWAG